MTNPTNDLDREVARLDRLETLMITGFVATVATITPLLIGIILQGMFGPWPLNMSAVCCAVSLVFGYLVGRATWTVRKDAHALRRPG